MHHLGLTSEEASIRLKQFGFNDLVPSEESHRLRELVAILTDPMGIMLIGLSAIYFFLGSYDDGIILLIALGPVVGTDVLLKIHAGRAMRALKNSVVASCTVLRDGHWLPRPARDVVPGDLVRVVEGDYFPADGRVIEANNLEVNESTLTGEATPVVKVPANPQMSLVFAGTMVLTGQAVIEVQYTGAKTKYGKIAQLIVASPDVPSHLQKRIIRLTKIFSLIACAIAIGIYVLETHRGVAGTSALVVAMSFAMSAIPEEFSIVYGIFLSLGSWRLAKRNILVRGVSAVETLAGVSVICTDKTGTLTHGEFGLDRLVPFGSSVDQKELIYTSFLACEMSPVDAMEVAIHSKISEFGLSPSVILGSERMLFDYPFEGLGKHMSHVWQGTDGQGVMTVAMKGSAEGVAEHAQASDEDKERWLEMASQLASQGYRVLGVAGAKKASCNGDRNVDESGLSLFGFLCFSDPVRKEVPATITRCQEAGIQIKIITGDHLLTAHAVADRINLIHADRNLITGGELMTLSDHDLASKMVDLAVIARADPEQKYRIVSALQAAGKVVAMTGDGVNDGPALKKSDVGIAMGQRSTDVARSAARIVLLDDRFSSVADAIFEGRRVVENLGKSFSYLLTFKSPIVILTLIMCVGNFSLMFLPIHLVLLQLIIHPVSALLFEGEPLSKLALSSNAESYQGRVLGPKAVVRSLGAGVLLSLVSGGLYLFVLRTGNSLDVARSSGLASLVLAGLGMIWFDRSPSGRPWDVVFPRGRNFWLVYGFCLVLLIVFLQVPSIASILRLGLLDLKSWFRVLVCSAGAVATRMLWVFLTSLRPR